MLLCRLLFTCVVGLTSVASAEEVWHDLLTPDLDQWEVFIGAPHTSVQGLPEGTEQFENVVKGRPLGLNHDPKKVFRTEEHDGETVLCISGEIYGGLTSLQSYSNYHLRMEMKWGDKRWEPRLDQRRDSGVLYHCLGRHGAFWNVWKRSLECQIQETDFGDFIGLWGDRVTVRQAGGRRPPFDPQGDYVDNVRFCKCRKAVDKPHGQWNTVEIMTVGDRAVHIINGEVVFACKDAVSPDKTPLTEGQIQIQSEAAECYFRRLQIQEILEFPSEIKKAANF